jgi:putative transposase
MSASRNSKYYKKKMPQKDAVVKKAIEKVLPGCRKGRKKVIPLVQKDHPEIGAFRIRRVYVQSGFNLFQKPRSRRIQVEPNPLAICLKANEEWAMDFMSDALENGRRIRIFNIVDHYSRFFITSKISSSIPARMVIEYLENAFEMYGKPERIRTDNGPEFRSKLFQLWLKD